LNSGEIKIANRNDNDSAREIGIGGRERRTGVVVDSSKARSKRNSGEIVLNQPVNVDGGGGVAELNAGKEDEEECYD